jgi:thiamine-phosphate pyrophosphorylase
MSQEAIYGSAAAQRIRGLYAITPDWTDTVKLVLAAKAALEGGARVLQYRNKVAAPSQRTEHAIVLAALCQKFGATFIVNDHLDLALEVDADGVHLGADDGNLAAARKKLGPGKLLGASCYNRLDLAQAAARAGADHLAFGAVFPSSSKPAAVRAPLELFSQARTLGLPMVAIGGITADNARLVVEAGAAALAVITDLFDAPDIAARARQYGAFFK